MYISIALWRSSIFFLQATMGIWYIVQSDTTRLFNHSLLHGIYLSLPCVRRATLVHDCEGAVVNRCRRYDHIRNCENTRILLHCLIDFLHRKWVYGIYGCSSLTLSWSRRSYWLSSVYFFESLPLVMIDSWNIIRRRFCKKAGDIKVFGLQGQVI